MSKKKQIEEMAKIHCGMKNSCDVCMWSKVHCIDIIYAEALYNAGYRKQREGEWIEHEDDWCGTYYTCSICKCDWTTFDGTPQENNMRYCPECGAKMRKEDEGK